jgi:uncharacterized protein YchJ
MGIHPTLCYYCGERDGNRSENYAQLICPQCVKQRADRRYAHEEKVARDTPRAAGLAQHDNALCRCGSGAKYRKCCKFIVRELLTIPLVAGMPRSSLAKPRR